MRRAIKSAEAAFRRRALTIWMPPFRRQLVAARELSAQMAEAKVRSMGALGRIETATTVNKDYATAYSATMLVSVTVESRACVSSDDRSQIGFRSDESFRITKEKSK